ncbi:16S rRNA pseudouridine(516) synthase [Mycoplasmopsis cricetuli]|uniref:16S rRNA pseudouridine(516) synthase n=1 Tax=Mycoplasmopsis cricetuli TaxID=171283 RepID=UPI000470020C|nr:16S rRNA pseudouridine(516) synthase [Mycoplasmopsis cricetuli]
MKRIEKILSENTNYSRSQIKKLIINKQIFVNKNLAKIGQKIQVNDQIIINGNKINWNNLIYIMLNKPKGYISATKDLNSKTIFSLIDQNIPKKNLSIWGRLDKNTTGLIILSNDNKLGHKLLSPKNHVNKKYYVELNKEINHDLVQKFLNGVYIGKGELVTGKLEIININKCFLTISEGKFHQIKRMFFEHELEVKNLKRIKFGHVSLDDNLLEGQWRYLTNEEILSLKKLN